MSTNPEQLTVVAQYTTNINNLLGLKLPCGDIFQSPGLRKHILKRHPDCIKYIDQIKEIISTPDYVGTNPKEKDSVEFIKRYDENILVAVKLDLNNNYLYVASIYDISDGKVSRRVNSGRLIKLCIDSFTTL